jgi:hypothetical protein
MAGGFSSGTILRMPALSLPHSFYLINGIISLVSMLALMGVFFFTPVRRSRLWTIVVTPLASIIGSGFLVVAPLLYRSFGKYNLGAIAILNLLALGLGWIMQTNILHFEPHLQEHWKQRDWLYLTDRASSIVLALAYTVSVGFYLSLLSSFALQLVGVHTDMLLRLLTTAILIFIGTYGFLKGMHGLEGLEKAAVNSKLSIIGGLLLALALSARFMNVNGIQGSTLNSPPLNLQSLLVLGGMLLVVQGFETARYLGADYAPKERARGLLIAQLVAAAVYLLFVPLASSLAGDLSGAPSETEIIAIVGRAAFAVAPTLALAAVFSQFGAAVADTVGTGGIIEEESQRRIPRRQGYIVLVLIAMVLIWSRSIFSVLALASRAFALYYLFQSVIAIGVMARSPGLPHRRLKLIIFPGLAMVMLGITVFAIPAY